MKSSFATSQEINTIDKLHEYEYNTNFKCSMSRYWEGVLQKQLAYLIQTLEFGQKSFYSMFFTIYSGQTFFQNTKHICFGNTHPTPKGGKNKKSWDLKWMPILSTFFPFKIQKNRQWVWPKCPLTHILEGGASYRVFQKDC